MAIIVRSHVKRSIRKIVLNPNEWYCEGCQVNHPGSRQSNHADNGKNYCNKRYYDYCARQYAPALRQARQSN